MATDPIVSEVRKAREAYARSFKYDVRAMWRDLVERQRKTGRQVVSLPARRIKSVEVSGPARVEEPPNEGMEPAR
jgi:hypothetical protein